MASRLGKMPTTSVRRRISRLSRSCGLLLQIWRQCSFGNAVKASRRPLGYPTSQARRQAARIDSVPLQTRRHHYVPRFLQAGFTDTGTEDGFLHVHDVIGAVPARRARPGTTAHARDFYAVEIQGEDPALAEELLGRIESAAAPIIRRVLETQALPVGDDLGVLLYFIAILAARVPKQREGISRVMHDLMKLTLEVATSTPERYQRQLELCRQAGKEMPDVPYEEMREAIRENLTFDVDQTWKVGQVFRDADTIGRVLPARRWCILLTEGDGPSFICSDAPVALVPTEPRQGFFQGVGWGMPGTAAFIPLSKRIALCGMFDDRLTEDAVPVGKQFVSQVNAAMLATAHKHVYSPREDFLWLRADGRFRHASDLNGTREPA